MTENEKERVLLVGQNPDRYTGNGNMLYSCAENIDREKYTVCAFLQGDTPTELMFDPFTEEYNLPFNVIPAAHDNDTWGNQKLLNVLYYHNVDQLIFIGIDIWRYAGIYEHISKLQAEKEFAWKAIVPYDLEHIRNDWLEWLRYPDQVFIYSQHGYEMLKPHLNEVYYFRPQLRFEGMYNPPTVDEKKDVRQNLFPDIKENTTIIGFIGTNQMRKNIFRMLQGIALAVEYRKKQIGENDIVVYIHIGNHKNPFDIEQITQDLGIPDYVIRHNGGSRTMFPQEMSVIYKALDVHLLPSLQEGLSWTVIEAGLTGIPSIISDSTAHKDFGNIKNGIFKISPAESSFVTLMTKKGPAYVQAKACSPNHIAMKILEYMDYKDKNQLAAINQNAIESRKKWCKNCHNISAVLESKIQKKTIKSTEMGELI